MVINKNYENSQQNIYHIIYNHKNNVNHDKVY